MPIETRGAGRFACIVLALTVSPAANLRALIPSQPVQAPPRAAATLADSEKQAHQLVVMIRGTMGGEPVIGAGVIFFATTDRLYVATANHVLRRGRGPQAAQRIENLEVKLNWLPGEWVVGQLTEDLDTELDLAVLWVKTARGPLAGSQPFARLGRPVARRDGVYAVGYPGSRPWAANIKSDPVSEVTTSSLKFQTQFVQQGHSGGGLFNESWELVGLIKQDQPPEAVAIRIDAVIDQLKQWNYTVALSPAPVATTPPSVSGGTTSLGVGGGGAPDAAATGVAEVRRMHDRDAWGDSLPLLKRLIDEQTKSPELLALRSHAYSHLDRPAEALADGEQAVKLGPKTAEAYLRRGEAYSAQGKHQLAIADYDQAIKLDPNEAEAYANRAAALAIAGQNDKALQSANRALAMRTDRYEYWLARGEIHALLKNSSAAIDDLTQAIKLRPQLAMLYRGRANMHMEAKQYQPALQDLDEALRIDPNEPVTRATRGMLHSHIGNTEAAKADLAYALRLSPGQKEWTALLQGLEAANPSSGGGAARAPAGATGGPASEPPPAGGYARLVDDALAAMRAQRTAEANELVDRMIRLDPSRSEGWSLRGSLAMNAFDNLPAAYEALENALARGGAIYFRLAHDHGTDQQPCLGTLTISGAAVAYAGDTGGHRYNWPYATIQEAAINGFYGSALGMFHIKSQPPGGRSETFNFAVIRQWDQQVVNRRPDADMLLGFINRQRAAQR